MNYTPKQLQIMQVIRRHIREKGVSPTLEEIGNEVGCHRVTVHQHVGALVKKGALGKLERQSRAIVIVDPDFARTSGYENLVDHLDHGGCTIELRETGMAVVVKCKCGDEIIAETK